MQQFFSSTFLRFLFRCAPHVDDDQQQQHGNKHNGRQRVDLGRDLALGHRIHDQRQGTRTRAGREIGNDKERSILISKKRHLDMKKNLNE